jgi:hypothetical protein
MPDDGPVSPKHVVCLHENTGISGDSTKFHLKAVLLIASSGLVINLTVRLFMFSLSTVYGNKHFISEV